MTELRPATETHPNVDELKEQLERLEERFAAGEVSEEEFDREKAQLEGLIAEAKKPVSEKPVRAEAPQEGPPAPAGETKRPTPHSEEPAERGEPSSERTEELTEQAAEEAAQELVNSPDVLKEAVATAAPGASPAERAGTQQMFESVAGRNRLAEKIKAGLMRFMPKSFAWREALIGFGLGFATRTAMRITFGSSLGLSFAAGAVGGALAGGGREFVRQRREIEAARKAKVRYEDIARKFDEVGQIEQVAALVAETEKLYKEARVEGEENEVQFLGGLLREKKLLLEAEARKGEFTTEKERVLAILHFAEKGEEIISKSQRKDIEHLIADVAFGKSRIDRKKLTTAIGKGAAFGALGGIVGGAVAHWIFEYFQPSGATAEEIARQRAERVAEEGAKAISPESSVAAPTPPEAEVAPAGETSRAAMDTARAAAAVAPAAREAVEEIQKGLLEAGFTVGPAEGEGLTHISRKLIHDYLVNQKQVLGDSFEGLSKEQLVYAEDFLQKKLAIINEGTVLKPDTSFTQNGAELAEIIQKAEDLTPKQLEHVKDMLEKDPSHYLSKKTVEFMTNFDELTYDGNKFYEALVKQAGAEVKNRVEEAMAKGAAAGAQEATEVAGRLAESAAQEKGGGTATTAAQRATDATIRWWLVGAGGAFLGGALAARKMRGKGRGKGVTVAETDKPKKGASSSESETSVTAPATESADRENPTGESGAPREESSERKDNEPPPGGSSGKDAVGAGEESPQGADTPKEEGAELRKLTGGASIKLELDESKIPEVRKKLLKVLGPLHREGFTLPRHVIVSAGIAEPLADSDSVHLRPEMTWEEMERFIRMHRDKWKKSSKE